MRGETSMDVPDLGMGGAGPGLASSSLLVVVWMRANVSATVFVLFSQSSKLGRRRDLYSSSARDRFSVTMMNFLRNLLMESGTVLSGRKPLQTHIFLQFSSVSKG